MFSTATRWSPTRLAKPSDADRLGGVGEQRLPVFGIGPGLGHRLGAVVRADAGLVGLDDGVERLRIDIALLGQDGFQRPHAQLRLGQLRAVLVVVMMLVIVVVSGHGNCAHCGFLWHYLRSG